MKNPVFKKLQLTQSLSNNLGFALSFACEQFFRGFFLELGRFIFFPFSAATIFAGMLLTFYAAWQKKQNRARQWDALVIGITGFGIIISLLGGLIASAAFAVAGPILALTAASLRCLYFAALAFYQGYLFLKTNHEKHQAQCVNNAVSAFGLLLTVIAMGLVLIALKASFGVLGMIGSLIPLAFTLYDSFKRPAAKKEKTKEALNPLLVATTPKDPGFSLHKKPKEIRLSAGGFFAASASVEPSQDDFLLPTLAPKGLQMA